MGCGSAFNPFDGDFWTGGAFLDPGGAFVGGALGLHGPGAFAVQPWNIATYVKEDWRAIKHLLVPDMRRDREVNINNSLTNRRLIYGRTRVGMQLGFAATGGASNEYLHVIAVFCGHPVDAIEQIWLGDKLATDSVFTGKLTYELFDGTQTTACQSLITALPTMWTADHKLLGCAYGYFKFTYNEGAYPSGLPTIKAVIRGRKVLDPRTNTTAWSDNPALCAYDYMMLPASQGGMGCAAGEVDVTSVIAAADRCDEVVY